MNQIWSLQSYSKVNWWVFHSVHLHITSTSYLGKSNKLGPQFITGVLKTGYYTKWAHRRRIPSVSCHPTLFEMPTHGNCIKINHNVMLNSFPYEDKRSQRSFSALFHNNQFQPSLSWHGSSTSRILQDGGHFRNSAAYYTTQKRNLHTNFLLK